MNTGSPTLERAPDARPSGAGGRGLLLVIVAFLAGVALTVPVMLLLADGGSEVPPDTTVPSAIVAYAAETPSVWAVVENVDVRSEPGMSASSVTSLTPDATGLESTGRIAITADTLWREISLPGGGSGWVPAESLAEPQPAGPSVDPRIPAEALSTANAIAAAARDGDLETLAEIAMEGDMPFTATFGDEVTSPAELVSLWESIGEDEVIAAILGLVGLPDWYETAAQTAGGDVVAIFVTPRFMHEPSNAENRRLVEEALGADYVERAVADGQYLGWRLGITADGDWRFFVSGD
ncbi:MAG TPA: hypothetical protein VLB67_07365 [Acidimicrobiia bacterium]|nr:hypothetical protein [Acidimicrobiia bacterium]